MAPIFRSLCSTAHLVLVAALALAAPAMAQTMTIAESVQAGPLLLGDQATSVKLAASQGALGTRLPAGQIYLVLDKIRAEAAVQAVYEVYFDLPAGAAPSRGHPHYVGDFNFFDAESGRRGASFNITDLVAELQRRGALGDSPTVTIVPNGAPAAAARPSIGSIAIVARAP